MDFNQMPHATRATHHTRPAPFGIRLVTWSGEIPLVAMSMGMGALHGYCMGAIHQHSTLYTSLVAMGTVLYGCAPSLAMLSIRSDDLIRSDE
jgi:hypothetical protein